MKYSITFFKALMCLFFMPAISLVSTHSSAAEKALPLSSYFTQTWNTSDGLPHNGINAISQTPDGYLWVATWEGLARFNGREFKVFARGSKAGLPDSAVKSLTLTQSGKFLIAGARGGISERYNNQWSPGKPAATMINHAIYDEDENLWLALEGKGLVFRNTKTNQDTVIINNIRAYKLLRDSNNVIWAATNKGVFSIENKTLVRHFGHQYGLPNKPARDLLLTKENHLLVATQQGVYKLTDGHFDLLHQQLRNENVNSLLQDSTHNIWIGTDNHGIFRLTKNTLEQLNDQSGLPNNKISALFQDKEQSIWIGTYSGLFRLIEAPFVTLTTKQGLSGNYTRSVLSHSDGSVWVGTSKGLNKVIDNKISSISVNTLEGEQGKELSILSLAETPKKQVLVGTYNNGLYITTKQGLQELLTTKHGLPSNEIRSILVDSANNTWVGTASGLAKISPDNHIEILSKETGLPASFIMALAEDKFGHIWIGTGDGIASYYQGNLQTYRLNDQFDAEYAFGFYVEQTSLWMATDRGLIHINLDTHKISAVSKKNGLPVDKIFQIVKDNNDTFWLTSNRGVINVSKDAIYDVIEQKSGSIDYKLFAEGVGLLSSQINGGSTPAATLDKNGSVWVATAKGVSHINDKIVKRIAETVIPVVIEQLEVDGKAYPIRSTVTLPKGASQITIHYAGLGYLMPKHISYQTKLIGFNNRWTDKQNKTFTEFTNLPPGKYTFQMRAKYPSEKWQGNIVAVDFVIPPFYWQTSWFKLLVTISLLIFLYLIYRYRMITIQRDQIKLKKLVAQQTLELQKQTELFSYQATHDQLTGLFNRRAFDEWSNKDFSKAKIENKPLTIAIVDIDNFKRVNDEYSHLIGDKVITKIAETLQELAEKSSYQIKLARWGGEEFTLLINHDIEKSYDFCELLRATVKSIDFSDFADKLRITISIGLTDNKVTEYDKMLNYADQALYFAKHNGRNQVKIYQAKDHENNAKVNNRINEITRTKSREDKE